MKLRVLSAVFASIACTVGVLAQDTSSQTTPKSITVTGCLQRATASPTGTTGSTSSTTGSTSSSASSSEPKFILTNASMGSGSSSSSTSTTTGTTGTASRPGMSGSEYRLDASDAKLSPHVGHKVEITGTLDSSSTGSSSTSSTSSTASTSSSTSSSNAPKLKVDDVKMVAATCP